MSSASSDSNIMEKVIEVPAPTPTNPNRYLATILTYPVSAQTSKNSTYSGYLTLILHGNGGHKNNCYHGRLAQRLSSEFNIWSVRFDFRGSGDSPTADGLPNSESKIGRTLDNDLEDMDIIIDYFTSDSRNLFDGVPELNLKLYMIVAHSRGSLAMFNWALNQGERLDDNIKLVNCAGRFDGRKLLERIKKNNPDWEANGGYYLPITKEKKVWVPVIETYSITNQQMQKVSKIRENVQVLSVYGSEDAIIPQEDKYFFDEALKDRHQLVIIDDADHNFYGLVKYTDEQHNDGTVEIDRKPYLLHKRKMVVDYNPAVVDVISKWIKAK